MSTDLHDQARLAAAALETLRRAALTECTGKPAGGAVPALELHWCSAMSAEELAQAALDAAMEATAEGMVFQAGRVYCFACRSSACEHAAPHAPSEVFAGYGSLGQPQWEELFSVLLALGDRRTDRLFAERPEMLAAVVERERLVAGQLLTFGKNSLTYRVWGEVVAGYFPIDAGRAELSVQIVETRDRQLHFQLIADPRLRGLLADTPEDQRSPLLRVHDALREAQLRLDTLNPQWAHSGSRQRGHAEKLHRKLFDLLRHLARSLEHKGRQEQRRTVHAETRGQQSRPVHVATADLAAATVHDFFRDAFRGSIIVLGKSGRCHVFSPEGRHITTLSIGRDELASRQRRRRYLPLETEAIAAFRAGAAPAPEKAD